MLEDLYNRGLLKNVVSISGVSSGALNSVMLNGILSGRITWKAHPFFFQMLLVEIGSGIYFILGVVWSFFIEFFTTIVFKAKLIQI